MSRDLSALALCAVMIDGIHMGEHVVLVALGIDEHGKKHVLGMHEGATENAPCAPRCSMTWSLAVCGPTARCSSSSTAARCSARRFVPSSVRAP